MSTDDRKNEESAPGLADADRARRVSGSKRDGFEELWDPDDDVGAFEIDVRRVKDLMALRNEAIESIPLIKARLLRGR